MSSTPATAAEAALFVEDPTTGRFRPSDAATAKNAARSITAHTGAQRSKVLAAIVAAGELGHTDDELTQLLAMHRSSCSTRRKELEDAELVTRLDITRRTTSGRPAYVYVATELGRDAAAQLPTQ